MSKNNHSIVKVWFSKPKEAWYSLSEKNQEDFLKKEQALVKNYQAKYGIRFINRSNCFWSNEDWLEFGIEEFPDIVTVQEYNEMLLKVGLYRYFESKVLLGTPIE